MQTLGLLGKDISYSFSRTYFNEKFIKQGITNIRYENFDIDSIKKIPKIIKNTPNLKGLNVTIPYKEAIIPYLDDIDSTAKYIGAVNTIKITTDKKCIGYNTDFYGFLESIKPHIKPHHNTALILGTGGASKAIAYALDMINISYKYVSRQLKKGVTYTYNTLTEHDIRTHHIIINCTPLGTFPGIEACPNILYNALTKHHILYDLIYNPNETKFLKQGKACNATTINGLHMLELQAEKSWDIWNA